MTTTAADRYVAQFKSLILQTIIFCLSLFFSSANALANECVNSFDSRRPSESADINPFLVASDLPNGAFRFDLLKPEHFRPAFLQAIADVEEQLLILTAVPIEEANFDNTIRVLDALYYHLDRLRSFYSNLIRLGVVERSATKLSGIGLAIEKLDSRIFGDKTLLLKLKKLYEIRFKSNLSESERRILESIHNNFSESRPEHQSSDDKWLLTLTNKLNSTVAEFQDQLNADLNDKHFVVYSEADLRGIPQEIILGAKIDAEKRGLENKWVLNIHSDTYFTIQKYAQNRALREALWRLHEGIGEDKNIMLALKILRFRHELAKGLGYENYSDQKLKDTMAHDAKTVIDFLQNLALKYRKVAQKELNELTAFARSHGFSENEELKPWDIGYYSELYRNVFFQFDAAEIKPYLKLETVVDGALSILGAQYNIKFRLNSEIPTWDPKVMVYEAYRETGQHVGLLYLDLYKRQKKDSGSRMNVLQSGAVVAKKNIAPHIYVASNFSPESSSGSIFLTLREVESFFHELGHAAHALLIKADGASYFGASMPADFLEIPSMLQQQLAMTADSLKIYARHFQTNEQIPSELIDKAIKSTFVLNSVRTMEQISLAILDILVHTNPAVQKFSAVQFVEWETKVTKAFRPVSAVAGYSKLRTAGHMFDGRYGSVYYSYLWSKVHAADAAEYVAEKKSDARMHSFRLNIMEGGRSVSPMGAYIRFRDRPAEIDALLRSDGILEKQPPEN